MLTTFCIVNLNLVILIIIFLLQFPALEAAMKPRLYEGDECDMGNRKGICTRESKCTSLEEEVRNNIVKAQDVICGVLAREPVVCCKLETETFASTSDLGSRPIKKACENVRKSLHPIVGAHVLGGKKVDYGELPFVVALGYQELTSDEVTFRCGGTLIDSRFVLTAAHCIKLKGFQLSVVRIGINNLNDPEELRKGVYISIKQSYIHCDYLKGYNDIAILELEEDAYSDFSHLNIRATCLSWDMNEPAAGADVMVAGFGWIDDRTRESSSILLKGNLKVVDLDSCNKSYATANPGQGFGPNFKNGLQNTHLCAWDDGKKIDACRGDSGGPLIEAVDVAFGDYRVVGVISTGYGCASPTPGLYTRVAAFVDFIEDIVWHKKPHQCI